MHGAAQKPAGTHASTMNGRKPLPKLASGTPRAWQRMLSGRRLDLLDPSPLDVEIEDIAHGLARVARWNGQTRGAHIFSVAQHALLVECIARQREPNLDRKLRLAILLHDAPEYVIGDMITPFKAVIGDSYKAVELRLLRAIHVRFGLPAETPVSRALSKELRARGFRFAGPTVVYAFMQATGMVNDHLVRCHRHAALADR